MFESIDTNTGITIFAAFLIPIITYFIDYIRKTNAKKERKRSAFKDIEAIIAKNLTARDLLLSYSTIRSIVRAKEKEYSVDFTHQDIDDIYDNLITQFISNDFIPSSDKQTLIESVNQLKSDLSAARTKYRQQINTSSRQTTKYRVKVSDVSTFLSMIIIVSIIGIVFGIFSALTPLYQIFNIQLLMVLMITVVIGITVLDLVKRILLDSQSEKTEYNSSDPAPDEAAR
jgi:hypothetical protein